MRLLFLFCLISLLGGVASVILIESDPGYAFIAVGGYTIESSVWFLFFVIFLGFLLVFILSSLFRSLIQSHGKFRDWIYFRGSRRSVKFINGGIINWIEGNWEKSRTLFLKSAKHSESPLLNYLMAARASYKLGENERMLEYLKVAQQSDGEAGVAIELTQAEMCLEAQHFEQALATLVRARRNADRHPYVLELLCKAYLGVRDWENLQKLLNDLKQYEVFSQDKLDSLEYQIYLGLLESRIICDEPIKTLTSRWDGFPPNIKRNKYLICRYAELLIANSGYEAAEDLIFSVLKQRWDVSLVSIVGAIEGGDCKRRFNLMESWLPGKERDATLLLCLGRLAMQIELLSKAKEFFLKSLSVSPSFQVYSELGRLSASLGDLDESVNYFEKGVRSVSDTISMLPESTQKP